ncbi:MAG: response regulator [Methanoregula sp.]|uniref:response regulator n=1 Tax=Methanoregula sp. TaxID=2052170 RepID=UPI003C78103C
MNSEPSGTDEDIHGGENAIDIFILCKDARDSQQLIGQLTPPGYRVTLFLESTDLVESLRAGKPNLLICDTTGPEQDGYEVCREIKKDDDLWRIPVLLITGVASLGDLLIVLDSNADNFIARPYDPQYLLSLVDMMLNSAVEKPDPEKIRTQFKIQHEDREYVITADRRKLLEFLLSSFEIAVSRAADLGQIQSTLDGLKSTLERRVAERTSELSTETARLQMISNGQVRDLENARKALAGLKTEAESLKSRIEEREKVIAGKTEDLARLTQELESTRARLAESDDMVRTLGTEKTELELALRGDAETLNRDLEQARSDLSAAKKELAEVSGFRAELEAQLARLKEQYEESEKALSSRSIEFEQIKSALISEKNRADAAEQEVKSIMQEKARSEQDLRQMVEDITGKAKQLSQDSMRFADELTAEKEQRAKVEQQYSELAQETAKKEAAFVAEKGTFMEHHDALQQKYDVLTESVGAERQKSATLEANLAHITAAHEQTATEMQALQERLDAAAASLESEKRMRAGVETKIQEITDAKDQEMQVLNANMGALRQDLEAARASLIHAEQERDASRDAHKSISDELAAAEFAKIQSEKLARSAATEMEQAHEELESERRMRHAAEEKLSEITQVKEHIEQNLSASAGQAAAHEQEMLAKIQDLSASLASENEARRAAEENLAQVSREKEQAEQNLHAVASAKASEDARREDTVKKLSDDLRAALDRQRSLEEELHKAGQEQNEKVATLRSLALEIDQAGAEIEAEKEKRHAAEEECAEAKDALAALRKKTQIPSALIEEVPIQNHMIVTKRPDFPTVIMHGPQALARKEVDHLVPVQRPADPVRTDVIPETDAPQVRIRTVEDLFEEPGELDIDDLSDAVTAPGLAGNVPGHRAPETTGDDTIDTGAEDDEDESGECEPDEADDTTDEDETGDDGAGEGDEESESGKEPLPEDATPTFSRQQWFDLMKWAHTANGLSHEDRIRFVKLGRLIQKGRRLTGRQEAQLAELVTLAHAMGYRTKE